MQALTPSRGISSFFKLPDDWIVEGKPRTNSNYAGVVDKVLLISEHFAILNVFYFTNDSSLTQYIFK